MSEEKIYDFKYQNLEFEKTAVTNVSRSSASWEMDIIKKLSAEKPFVLEGTDYVVNFKEVDGDRGYAFGSVRISNVPPQSGANINAGIAISPMAPQPERAAETKAIFIPITIKDFQLNDFDIFVVDGQPKALTDQNFFRHMFNSDVFANTAPLPQNSRIDSMAEKQAPPGYASHAIYNTGGLSTYASAGMEKEGFTNDPGHFMAALIPTICAKHRARFEEHVGGEEVMARFAGTPSLRIIDQILKGAPLTSDDKLQAFKEGLPYNLLRITKFEGDLYKVCMVSDWIFKPLEKEYHLEDLMKEYGAKVPGLSSILLDPIKGKDFVVAINHKEQDLAILEDLKADPKFLDKTTAAVCIATDGNFVKGYFCPNVFEPTGAPAQAALFLTGDSFAFQTGIVGEEISSEFELNEGSLSPNVWGTFMFAHEGNVAQMTPFKIVGTSFKDGKVFIRVVDIYSNEISYIITPGVEKVVNLTGNKDLDVGGFVSANAFAIPKHYRFIALGPRFTIIQEPEEVRQRVNNKFLSKGNFKKDQVYGLDSDLTNGLVIKDLKGQFSMEGAALSPITHTETQIVVNPVEASFNLMILGAGPTRATEILDKAKKYGRITVSGCKNLQVGVAKLASAVQFNKDMEDYCSTYLNKDLTKEAAELAGTDSVDKILSLSFINPENLGTYLSKLDRLEMAEDDLAQLLLLVRLGLDNVNEAAVVNALRNLSDVNENLRFLKVMVDKK